MKNAKRLLALGSVLCTFGVGGLEAAPTVAAEGFSSHVEDKTPVDSITKGTLGAETTHWVRWSGLEPGRQMKHVCEVFEPGSTEPAFREENIGAPSGTEDLTHCSFVPMRGYSAGTWRFVQSLDGRHVAESEIEIASPSMIDRIGKGKILAGVVAGLFLGAVAMFRKRGR